MNDLDLCLEVVAYIKVMATIVLHLTLTVIDRGLVSKDHWKWHMG